MPQQWVPQAGGLGEPSCTRECGEGGRLSRGGGPGLQAQCGLACARPPGPTSLPCCPVGRGAQSWLEKWTQIHLAGRVPAGAARRLVCRPSSWGHRAHGPLRHRKNGSEVPRVQRTPRTWKATSSRCRRKEGSGRSAGAAETGAWDVVGGGPGCEGGPGAVGGNKARTWASLRS